nr:PREDICTED: uncharacterized protein LOC105662535 isoform X3 [Megachile rotundata]
MKSTKHLSHEGNTWRRNLRSQRTNGACAFIESLEKFAVEWYLVNENQEDFEQERPLIGFRPQNGGPYGPNGRPIVPTSYPGNKGVLVGPGGPTGIIKRPSYDGSIDEEAGYSGLLASAIKDNPRYQEYDVCRCRYSFNCPSGGLKFGSCGKDKKFCCFNSKKYPALVSEQLGEGQYPPYRVGTSS